MPRKKKSTATEYNPLAFTRIKWDGFRTYEEYRQARLDSFKRLFQETQLDIVAVCIQRYWGYALIQPDDEKRDRFLRELWNLSCEHRWAWDTLLKLALLEVGCANVTPRLLGEFAREVACDKHPRPRPTQGQQFSDASKNLAILVAYQCLIEHCDLKKGEAQQKIESWCFGPPVNEPRTADSIRKTIERMRKVAPLLFGHE